MKIVAKKNWVYCVFIDGEGYVLSIPFGHGSTDFSRAFRLPLKNLDDEYLTNLTQEIKGNYEKYKALEVTHP